MKDPIPAQRGVRLSTRLQCCICGEGTSGSDDYVEIEVTATRSGKTQFFGAHAAHLSEAMAKGFTVEVHLMDPIRERDGEGFTSTESP